MIPDVSMVKIFGYLMAFSAVLLFLVLSLIQVLGDDDDQPAKREADKAFKREE